jgi:D-glycero-alpha-D-manno-heptose-7-phosphate kinase
MIVEARTPCRIDLAGGTLDLYPLYLFEGGGLTVNLAIQPGAYVRLETRRDRAIQIYSEDTKRRQRAATVDALRCGGPLDLIVRLIKHYPPSTGLNVVTRNAPPKGSGLGASSSLLIAISGALRELNGFRFTDAELIFRGSRIEAQNIGIPTGNQDFYPPMHGGVSAIWFDVPGDRHERIHISASFREELQRRLTLSFTGEPHYSAVTNWSMIKGYIEDTGRTRECLRRIKKTAYRMREALLAEDMNALGKVLAEEWDNRKRLARGVTTPTLERQIAAAARSGAVASKVCGAGGGGCMITLARPGREEAVKQALAGAGARVLDYRIDTRGLQVEREG